MYVEADRNEDKYREYIMDIMSDNKFYDLFREHLKGFVNDDQQLFIMHDDNNENGYVSNDIMNKIELIGIIVIVTCFTLCMIMIGYYSRKWYKIMDTNEMEGMNQLNDEDGQREFVNLSGQNEDHNVLMYGDGSRQSIDMSKGDNHENNVLKIYRKVTITRRKTGVKFKGDGIDYGDSIS